MKKFIMLNLFLLTSLAHAQSLPEKHTELLKYVQPAPDQGETNTCLFMASTGALELLLNKQAKLKNPKVGGPNDLSESFLIWQADYNDQETETNHFIEGAVIRFNHGEAVHNSAWPFKAYYEDKTDSLESWNKHPDFVTLSRRTVPKVKTTFLFSRGKKFATHVLGPEDVTTVKRALVEHNAPVIINYNDDGYWHVVLIVGYDDKKRGNCYELEASECGKKGAFYVRDSNGKKFEARDYNWFLIKANAAALVELR